jgi:hypothetical protein
MKKDVLYRLKNSENIPWRKLLYLVAKQFRHLINDSSNNCNCFIVDDTPIIKQGNRAERMSLIHDHANKKNKRQKGYKNLVLAYFDGKSTIPIDYSLHSEKKLSKKYRKKQYNKKAIPNTSRYKRRKECKINKIINSLSMIKRAVKHGFIAKYVLCDSWFTSKEFIEEIKSIKSGKIDVIGGVRKDKRKYIYTGNELNAKGLLEKLKKTCKAKRSRKWRARYYELVVEYPGIGEVKLYFCKMPYQKNWRLYISTDLKVSFHKLFEIYSIRWTVEVMFKELKQYLKYGKCHSLCFDAQIAEITTKMILYIFLVYYKRIEGYETTGAIFEYFNVNINEKTLIQRIWELFDDLLMAVIDNANDITDMNSFRDSYEYNYIKKLFENSFIFEQNECDIA